MALFLRELAENLTNQERGKGCVAYDPKARDPTYGYVPNLAAGIIFTVIFSLSLFAHIVQVYRSRKWWYSSLALGAFGEALGWAGRAAAHHCPYSSSLFSLQISILIISPCFFSAALYYILGQMIRQYGRRYSFIGPNTYLYIFISFDLLSIVIQAVGGGLASSAGAKDPPGDTATTFSASCVMIRNHYRAVELGQGWDGYLIKHEVYFAVLDAALMVMAVVVFKIFFPTRYLSGEPSGEKDAHEMPKSYVIA